MLRNIMKKKNILTVCAGIFLVVCVAGTAVYAQAQSVAAKKPTILKKEVKNIQGDVTWIAKNKIAIVYGRGENSEEEIMLPFDKDVALERIGDIAEIKQWDTVSVQYEETTQEAPGGGIEVINKAKTISFIRAGTRKPFVPQQPNEGAITESGQIETDTLTSE